VNLEENSFIQFVVEQRGIDLFVKVVSPAGKNLGEYDTPNGPEGPVSFVAAAAGTYRITISPLGTADQTTGRYEIKVLELRKATDDEIKANKNLEEVKAKGIALLAEIEATIPQIKSPHNRIQAQLKAAELLWDINEKRAARLMADAIAGIKEFMADPCNITQSCNCVRKCFAYWRTGILMRLSVFSNLLPQGSVRITARGNC
jgi:hypothetical protein